MRPFWITFGILSCLFAILFAFRLDLFHTIPSGSAKLASSFPNALPREDSWMNILQNDRKIGSSHTVFLKTGKGYILRETLHMRLNTMGLIQEVVLKTTGNLNADFTLSSFSFNISSGRFHFSAKGSVSKNILSIQTQNSGSTKDIHIRVGKKIYIPSGIINAAYASGMKPGDTFIFQVIDPLSMTREPVRIRVMGREKIVNMGIETTATKLAMIYKGTTQLAWIGENGDVIREKGFLGIRLEKTTRDRALLGLQTEPVQDLTEIASVPSNKIIENPMQLKEIKVKISNISFDAVQLEGGRQTVKDRILFVNKEDRSDLPDILDTRKIDKKFLMPSVFIESDHVQIQDVVKKIVSTDDSPLKKADKLVAWIHKNIEKRPVLSLPDALETLNNRVGDCNEHAVLLAAFARAAGIPAKIEAGLVYLNGRFYYHAWNLLYLGKWITADSIFGQIPADVTHIRFSSGSMQNPLDLMGIIGKIRLKVITFE